MEVFLLVVVFAMLAVNLAVVLWSVKMREKAKENPQALTLLQNQISEIGRTVDSRLNESAKLLQHQFGTSFRVIRDVTEKLTKLDETNKQVVSFADQLKNLQDILKNPKQRGILGEYYLETVLKNVLPPGAYQMQYAFKDGLIVDAAIFVKERIIPVDSKFSLENYNRLIEAREELEKKKLEDLFKMDLKNRIDETSKYIKPAEGTMDFAFMFMPAEAPYYDLLVSRIGSLKDASRNLIEYAFAEKKVIIVSPTSFLAYLQTVLQGLRALKIEESAKEIMQRVEELRRHLSNYETYMKKMGGNLGTTVNMYNNAYKEFGKIDKDVLHITGAGVGSEPVKLEKPDIEDRS